MAPVAIEPRRTDQAERGNHAEDDNMKAGERELTGPSDRGQHRNLVKLVRDSVERPIEPADRPVGEAGENQRRHQAHTRRHPDTARGDDLTMVDGGSG